MRKNLIGGLLVLGLLLCGARTSLAGSGSLFTLPLRGASKSGLRLTMDTRWVDAAGYRAVRFGVVNSNGTPAMADRTLRLEFRPSAWRYGGQSERTIAYLEFPQGALSAETWVPVRQDSVWGSITFEVFEDGERLKDLCENLGLAVNSSYVEWTESFPCILFVDEDAPPLSSGQVPSSSSASNKLPDFRLIASQFPDNPYYGLPDVATHRLAPISDLKIRDRVERIRRYDIRSAADLPEQWILYSCFDMIVISLEDARDFSAQHPKKWSAILRHVGTGATLCVYGAGRGFEHLREVEDLCRYPQAVRNEASETVQSRWQDSPAMRNQQVFGLHVNSNLKSARQQERQQLGMGEVAAEFVSPKGSERSVERPFSIRNRALQLGEVVAIDVDWPFPGDKISWNHVFNTVGHNRWQWRARHGISMIRPNDEFWKLMIPGVGMAPVTSFIVLITLFAVVMGPINYILLNRWRRLYLLLVTVPVGAAVVSMVLLGYAVINDGLGVRVRARSYTLLDQRNRQFVAWARQTYYAGLAPSGGLRFPKDAEVYPIHEIPPTWQYRRNVRYETTWEDLQYMQGYFSSRTTSQFLTINSAYTNHQLQVTENGSQPPRVKNLLGTDIELLVLRASDGKLYAADAIQRDQVSELGAAVPEALQQKIRDLMRSSHPEYPEGYDPNLHDYSFGRGRRRYYYGYTNMESSVAKPSMIASILEEKIREGTAIVSRPLENRSYLALVSWAPDSSLGVRRVKEEGSFHVVQGRW